MNIQKMLQEAQKLQKKIEGFDKQVFDFNYKDLIIFQMEGSGKLLNLKINNELIDKDDPDTLQDLLITAINDAKASLDKKKNELQNSLAGQMPKGFF
ncbi:YbaB/EbfC family nucleoid-associated protein [bacterium]|nr:YbaB/EbfC family nucleoid-associated protein [bacterium]MBR2652187.1 YbaB/EbfC family nucleoid-associated protein [bacterium]MBR2857713.1 YbaB/EbfC family nucleoid-associated protein [bacterium]